MQKFFIYCFTFFLILSFPLYAKSFSGTAAIVVSHKIKPYMNIVSGIKKRFEELNLSLNSDIYTLKETEKELIFLENQLINKEYEFIIAIGPEAAEFVFNSKKLNVQKFYSGVLNPDKIPSLFNSSGVSLRIPVSVQLKNISLSFPDVKKIGIVFNPKNNYWFYQKAVEASGTNIEIIPFFVSSSKDITKIIDEKISEADLVWMIPDKTVISERIIYYIIKTALYNNKGVIGYNSFFINAGAIFSFFFDYEKIGLQTADLIAGCLKTGNCRKSPPEFKFFINKEVVEKTKIRSGDSLCPY